MCEDGAAVAGRPTGDTVIVTNGVIEADLFDAWQYNWKSEPWKTLIKPLDKLTSTYYIDETGAVIDEYETAPTLGAGGIVGKVTLKYAASGAVTITGEFVTGVDAKNKAVVYKASGSSTLVPSADGNLVFIYLAPNTAKKFAGHIRTLTIGVSNKPSCAPVFLAVYDNPTPTPQSYTYELV